MAAIIVLIVSGAAARVQVGYWRDSKTLFTHAIKVVPNNYLAHGYLGSAFCLENDYEQAERHLREALKMNPQYTLFRYRLAGVLMQRRQLPGALSQLRIVVEECPDYANAYTDLGSVLAELGDVRAAQYHLTQAIKLNPADHKAHFNLGLLLLKRGRTTEAIEQFQEAVALAPYVQDYRATLEIARALLP